ncbi:MAG: NTP transferase domain-containing protein [Phycisphaeraceae bacterium]|nr:NTP transferase domain-containing protein [Phycisphaeraceae bacterium]MCW5763138.1 NTP transferase domain-containing protein [Phycisphaeraceae bacterium]
MHHPSAIILAAGKGTRMNSDLPKVCHPIGGRPMVCAVIDACLDAGCQRIVLVVGYRHQDVRDAVASYGQRIEFALQTQQLGTGHAVQSAAELFTIERRTPGHEVLVLCGDGPLIRASTLQQVLARHRLKHAAATLATSVIDDPDGYGRIVRNPDGSFDAIVEQKNCTPEQRLIREVNPSYYCFDCARLFETLTRVERDTISGEYYLTPVPTLLKRAGHIVEVIDAVPPEDVLSINTPEQLALVDRVYRARATDQMHERGGVR